MRILFQASKSSTHQPLIAQLRAENFNVDVVANLTAAKTHLNAASCDLIVLCPPAHKDTHNSILALRQTARTPIITLGQGLTIAQISRQLYAGADDVMSTDSKIHPAELIARIYAITSRTLKHTAQSDPTIIKTGNLTIDLNKSAISVNGLPIKTSLSKWRTIRMLGQRMGDFVSQEDISEEIQSSHPETIISYVRHLKKDIAKFDPSLTYIEMKYFKYFKLVNMDKNGKVLDINPDQTHASSSQSHDEKRMAHAQKFCTLKS